MNYANNFCNVSAIEIYIVSKSLQLKCLLNTEKCQ